MRSSKFGFYQCVWQGKNQRKIEYLVLRCCEFSCEEKQSSKRHITATPLRHRTALEWSQLATTSFSSSTTTTVAVDPIHLNKEDSELSSSSLASSLVSSSIFEKPATIIFSQLVPSTPSLPFSISSASSLCSRSRHACATLAPPWPSYTA